jgi:ribosomal protein S18 acetylase RimI-like enzyme
VAEAISLRRYEESDLSFLIALRAITMRPHIINAGNAYDETMQLQRVDYRLDCAQIITKDGRDIGLLKVVRESGLWELAQIQLLPEHQGTGLGTTLIRSVLEQAKDANVSVSLVVLRSNPAQHLYERLGFRVHEVRGAVYEMLWSPVEKH